MNTPGLWGYLLAVGVAFAWNGLFIVGSVMLTDGRWQDLPFAIIEIGIIEAFFGTAIAVPGVLILHLTCRRVPSQAVHVLVAAGLGALAGGALAGGIGNELTTGIGSLPVYVGAAAGLGRLAVVPMVRSRRAVPVA